MLFQLFRLRKTYKDIKEAKNDPRGFAEGQIKETALGALFTPLIPMLIVVALCFAFGYIIGDGSGFFRVVFWIFFIPFIIFSASIVALYKGVSKLARMSKRQQPKDGVIHVEAREIVE